MKEEHVHDGLPVTYGNYIVLDRDVARSHMVKEMNDFIRKHDGEVFRAEIIDNKDSIEWKVSVWEKTESLQPTTPAEVFFGTSLVGTSDPAINFKRAPLEPTVPYVQFAAQKAAEGE